MSQEPNNKYEDHLRKVKVTYMPHIHSGLVLDYGCGTGRVWTLLGVEAPNKRPGVEMYGYDIDEEAVRNARASLAYDGVVTGNSKLLRNIEWELVLMLGVLEHLEYPALQLTDLAESTNMLFLTVPNADSVHRDIGVIRGLIDSNTDLDTSDVSIGHKRVWGYHEFIEFVDNTLPDFGIVRAGTTCLKIHTSSVMSGFSEEYLDALDQVGRESGLCGVSSSRGAETFVLLERITT